jgi:hypothetical protein
MVSWVGIGALWLAYGIYGSLPGAAHIVLSKFYTSNHKALVMSYISGSDWQVQARIIPNNSSPPPVDGLAGDIALQA